MISYTNKVEIIVLILALFSISTGCATAPQRPTLIPPGDYEVVNPDELNFIEKVLLRKEDGLLVLDVLIPGADMASTDLSLAVSPISDTVAVIAGLGGRMPHIDGTLHAVIVDGEERLRYSGFEFRKEIEE